MKDRELIGDHFMVTVYGMRQSGNCYKVALLLEQLGQPYRWCETDILRGKSRTSDFLVKSPGGRVPVLEIALGDWLAESNAILYYLADGSAFFPEDRRQRAAVMQWLFFEQYSHEPYIAVARFVSKFLPPDHSRRTDLPALRKRGYEALDLMENHLRDTLFFASTYSIADISLFAYTSTASEGGYDLSAYQRVQDWIARVREQPGFIEAHDIAREN